MTNEQKKWRRIWEKIGRAAENPRRQRTSNGGGYKGLCVHLSNELQYDFGAEIAGKQLLRWAMASSHGSAYFWETWPLLTDNGDRILAAYFMAYSGLTPLDIPKDR